MRRLGLALLLLAGCGARTGLGDPDDPDRPVVGRDAGRDAGSASDAGPPIAPCGAPTPVGDIRFTLEGVTGGAAFGPSGDVYAPLLQEDRTIDLGRFDRCTGELVWQRPAMPESSGTAVRVPRVRFTSSGEVLLVNSNGFIRAYGLWRFTRDGEPLPAFGLEDGFSDFYAVPTDRGPVVRLFEDGVARIVLRQPDGSEVWSIEQSIQGEECVAGGDRLFCYSAAYDLADGRERWRDDFVEILDGTRRHVVPPAVDGRRLYAVLYGITSYDLEARALEDGETAYRVPLMRTSRGQSDIRLGRPVLGAGGALYVYANGHREDEGFGGALIALDADSGTERWRFEAAASEQEFFLHATHVAGDRAVYLAIGERVYGIDASGAELWRLAPGTAMNTPQIALSPAGDLAVRTDRDALLIIATESRGLADGPWPAPAGDLRNANAR